MSLQTQIELMKDRVVFRGKSFYCLVKNIQITKLWTI